MNGRIGIASILAALIALVGGALVVERGGLLAWIGLAVGLALLIKIYLRPSAVDLALSIGTAAVWALTWAGTAWFVFSTWESGEVVELSVETHDGIHTARVWALDEVDSLVLYYDAEPEIADALISGNPIRVQRQDQIVRLGDVVAIPVEDMPEDELNRLYGLMIDKYGDRNVATDVFYGLLGRSRDRVAVVVTIRP